MMPEVKILSEGAEVPEVPETLHLVHNPEDIAAWQADLERLLPLWLSLVPDERQWRLQRFLDKLSAQPELRPSLLAVLQQQLNSPERFSLTAPGIELLAELRQTLDLMS